MLICWYVEDYLKAARNEGIQTKLIIADVAVSVTMKNPNRQ